MFPTLPGGGQMPANGLGMCCRPSAYDEETVSRSVLWYLLQGGWHIDTAQVYLNHKPIGAAIAQAIERGVPRAEIWVTTKLHKRFYDRGEETILGMVQEWLKELQVEYLDLVLLHQPKPLIPLFVHKCTNWTQCTASAWKAMAKTKTRGCVRSIGVSNFNIEQLKEIQALGAAPIAVNQFMLNPFSPAWAFDIASFCKENGIAVSGNFSLGAPERVQRHPRTPGNPKHQKENLAIYSVTLTGEEMTKIDTLCDNPTNMNMAPQPKSGKTK